MLLLLCVLCTAAGSSQNCSSAWSLINGRCYLYLKTNVSFYEALATCKSVGGRLPILSTVDDLTALVQSYNWNLSSAPVPFWLGGLTYLSTNNNNQAKNVLTFPTGSATTASISSLNKRCLVLQINLNHVCTSGWCTNFVVNCNLNECWYCTVGWQYVTPPTTTSSTSLSCLQPQSYVCEYATGSCPSSWTRGSNACYRVFSSATWLDAAANCASQFQNANLLNYYNVQDFVNTFYPASW